MNHKTIEAAVNRLLANAYGHDDKGAKSHRQDVIVLRSAIRGSPDDARRYRFLREHITLRTLHAAIDERFTAPDRAYASQIDEEVDREQSNRTKNKFVLDPRSPPRPRDTP